MFELLQFRHAPHCSPTVVHSLAPLSMVMATSRESDGLGLESRRLKK